METVSERKSCDHSFTSPLPGVTCPKHSFSHCDYEASSSMTGDENYVSECNRMCSVECLGDGQSMLLKIKGY